MVEAAESVLRFGADLRDKAASLAGRLSDTAGALAQAVAEAVRAAALGAPAPALVPVRARRGRSARRR